MRYFYACDGVARRVSGDIDMRHISWEDTLSSVEFVEEVNCETFYYRDPLWTLVFVRDLLPSVYGHFLELRGAGYMYSLLWSFVRIEAYASLASDLFIVLPLRCPIGQLLGTGVN